MSQLYFVRADNEDGDNLDLFVRADSVKEAERMWAKYYDDNGLGHAPLPAYAAPIPDTPVKGVISWTSIIKAKDKAYKGY